MPDSQQTVGAVMRSATTTVEPDAHVASAAWLMKRANDSALVVTSDDGRVPIAVITDADVSQAAEATWASGSTVVVADRMTAPTVCWLSGMAAPRG